MKFSGSLKVPKKGASASEINQFLDRFMDSETLRRRELEEEWLEARAFVNNKQWLLRDKVLDPTRVPAMRESSRDGIPKPVTNRIFQAYDNEVARLSRRNSEVYVDPSSNSPDAKGAAKIGSDVMDHHLNDPSNEDGIQWNYIRREHIRKVGLYGMGILKSYLEQDALDTVKVGITDGAMRCKGSQVYDEAAGGMTQVPSCGAMLASGELSEEEAAGLGPGALQAFQSKTRMIEGAGGETEKVFAAHSCPGCGGPLEPFTPSGGEEYGEDIFGRPLGQDVPRGCAKVEVVSPLDVWFENEGIDVSPNTCKRWGQSTPRDVDDYIRRYYSHSPNVELVKPEDPTEIAKTHPILGEYNADAKGPSGVTERAIYRNHCRLREFYSDKSPDFPEGRQIVMAGNVVLVDDVLYVDGPNGSKPFPRVLYTVARMFPIDGEIYAHGMPYYGASIQKRINMTMSQVVDTREHSIIGVLATRGMKLARNWGKALAGYVLGWEPDPLAQGMKPEPFATGRVDMSAWKEIEHAEMAINEILGVADAETGSQIPGVTAYSQYRLMAEKASERREQREKELIDCYERTLQHQLKLIARFYVEPRQYRVKSQSGNGWERKEFTGSQIGGEFGLRVRETPQYDKSTAEREALANAIPSMPQFQPQNARQKRNVAKHLGIPKDVSDDQNVQLDAAERKWFQFVQEQKIPSIDTELDDPTIHMQTLGELLLSEDAVDMAEQSGWPKVLKLIANWQQDFVQTQQTISNARAQGWDGVSDLGQFLLQQQQAAMRAAEVAEKQYQLEAQKALVTGGQIMAQPPQVPPPLPTLPNVGNPPDPIEDLILWVWQGKIAKKLGGQATPPSPYMAMQAVYCAYKYLAQQQAGGQVAAPGAAPMPQAA